MLRTRLPLLLACTSSCGPPFTRLPPRLPLALLLLAASRQASMAADASVLHDLSAMAAVAAARARVAEPEPTVLYDVLAAAPQEGPSSPAGMFACGVPGVALTGRS